MRLRAGIIVASIAAALLTAFLILRFHPDPHEANRNPNLHDASPLSGPPTGQPLADYAASGSVTVLTYHNDAARTGQNLEETILTPGNVNSASFGKLGFLSVDGLVDAEPLYVSNLLVAGHPHNVVFAVTEHDSVYAFDADTLTQLWQVTVRGAKETPSDDRGCGQVSPEIGITSTPVISFNNKGRGTMYLVAMSKDTYGNYFQRLHALDVTTGAEISGSPTTINATFPNLQGGTTFDPKQY